MENHRSNKVSFIKFIQLAERVAEKHDPDTWERKLDSYDELLEALIEIDNYINKIEYKSMAMMVIRNKAKTAIKKYSDESKDA